MLTPLVRLLGRPPVGPKGWPLMLLLPVMAFISYMPVIECLVEIGADHNGTLGGSWYNYIENAPQAEMPDFYCGVIAAAIAKLYYKPVTKWFDATTAEHSFMRRYLAPLGCALAADGMVAITFWRILHYVPEDSNEADYDWLYVINYHSATLPISLFFLITSVTGGCGLTCRLLKTPALVSIGRYALYAYVFQIPASRLFYGALMGGPTDEEFKLDGDMFMWFIVMELGVVAAYAECIEEPLANAIHTLAKPLYKFKAAGM
jgi:hypothetical protein